MLSVPEFRYRYRIFYVNNSRQFGTLINLKVLCTLIVGLRTESINSSLLLKPRVARTSLSADGPAKVGPAHFGQKIYIPCTPLVKIYLPSSPESEAASTGLGHCSLDSRLQ